MIPYSAIFHIFMDNGLGARDAHKLAVKAKFVLNGDNLAASVKKVLELHSNFGLEAALDFLEAKS